MNFINNTGNSGWNIMLQHKAIMEFIAEYGPLASLSEVLQTVSQKKDEACKNIIEIDAERDKVLKEIDEKKGTDWVISQIAWSVSTSELIDAYNAGKI